MPISDSEQLLTEAPPPTGIRQSRLWVRARDTRLGDFVRKAKNFRHEIWEWARLQPMTLTTVDQLAASIAALEASPADVGPQDPAAAPIFLFSTGWRAGSTLLQRVLLTDPNLLLWGEPLGEMMLASRLAEMLGNSISPRNLRLWRTQEDTGSGALATSWIANLYPSAAELRSAMQALFDRWLARSAHDRGFARWGFKEVRFGAAEAWLLHWLYPNAKFLLLSRHPYDAWRSLADSNWKGVYYRYPGVGINSAAAFAQCWNQIALSWQQLPSDFPCRHIRYDDLIGGRIDFRELESWLDLRIAENLALKASVGGTAKRSSLNWYERRIIASVARSGMAALEYVP